MTNIVSEKFDIVIHNASEEDIDVFAQRIATVITTKMRQINQRIERAQSIVEKANNLPIGDVGFFKKIFTNQEKEQMKVKLAALGESGMHLFGLIQEQFELQQEAIRLTQLSYFLSDRMSVYLGQIITNGFQDTNGAVIKIDENTKKIITVLADSAKKYAVEQAKIEYVHLRLNEKDSLDNAQNKQLALHYQKIKDLKVEQDKKQKIDEYQEINIKSNTRSIQIIDAKLIKQHEIIKIQNNLINELQQKSNINIKNIEILQNKITHLNNLICQKNKLLNELQKNMSISNHSNESRISKLNSEYVDGYQKLSNKIDSLESYLKQKELIVSFFMIVIIIMVIVNFYLLYKN